MYRSGLEVSIAGLLRALKVEFKYEDTKLPYTIEHTYCPDFYIPDTDIYIEAKGFWRPEDRRKIKAIKEQHPEIDIRMAFQNPKKKISKGSKVTYAQWCDRKGILWCDFKKIPISWLTNEITKDTT